MIACWSEPRAIGLPASKRARAGPMPSARSRSVVGQKQAVVRDEPSSLMSRSLMWVACTAVVRGPSSPASSSSSVGVRP